jgi:hypothetical protein
MAQADSTDTTNPSLTVSRRTFFGTAAGAAACLSQVAPGTDPILDLIERHRAVFGEFVAASLAADGVSAEREGREVTQAAEDRLEAAAEADAEMRELLASTIPTTMAGLAAAVSWLVEYDEGCLPDTSGRFLRTLAKSDLLKT